MKSLDVAAEQPEGSRFANKAASELSGREVQVLDLVARGQANREIGASLAIAEGTVKNHLKSIVRKLAARDRTHAVVLAMAAGVLAPPAAIVGKVSLPVRARD